MKRGARSATNAGARAPERARGEGSARMRRAWWFGGSLVAAVLVASMAVAWNDYRVRREAGARYLGALVDSHARQVGSRIDSFERALHGLANGLVALEGKWPDGAQVFMREQAARIVSGHPHILGLRVDQARPAFVPERPRLHGLYLDRPERDGDGRWVIPLAMPFEPAPGGSVMRWLRAELDVAAFATILQAHEVGEHGVASLLTTDAILIARSDSGTTHAGKDASHSPVFDEHAGRSRGFVETTGPLDGIERIVGYLRIDGRPLVATVGMTPEALHGGWRTFAFSLALGMALLAAAWLLGMAFLMRAARRESRMRRAIAAREHAVDHLRERVRDAEEQYRFLYRQHPLPALVYDLEDLTILEANEAAQLQFGYGPDAMAGFEAGDLLGEGSTEDVRRHMQAHPTSLGRRVWVLRRSDGSHFSGLVFARNLASFAGRPARLVLVVDVTDRERAEANLELLRRAVEAAEEGVFILGVPLAALVYGNLAFARLTGIDPDEQGPLRKAAVDAIVDPQTRRLVLCAIARSREVQVEVRDRRDPADVRVLEVRMTPVLDGAGMATHFVGIVTDITVRKRAAEDAAYRARHDALTGLANRECLLEAINAAIASGGGAIIVCHLDLDRFQLVNDSLGHAIGDELLVSVARRLQAAAGAEACVARLGGDEFGVLLHDAPGGAVEARVEALRTAVAGNVRMQGTSLHVTPSLGYGVHPVDGGDATSLLRAASQAGAQAKRLGRNRSVAYRDDFDSHAGERLHLVQELHQALEREEFELAFQLQFDADGRPRGLESLVRWRHPRRGLLGPGEFIEACEETGLVLPLGRWVLREAARHWELLDARGWGSLRMGVNISPLQFQEGLVDGVREVMRTFRLPGDRLELELTESVLLASPLEARSAMRTLTGLGASIAIDDFGTGYSSLAYLKDLPLQRLKIDQSFVRDLGRDPGNEAICAAILQMAQGMEIKVVAEGIETWQQHAWLRERGCDEFQGYLLARPLPFEEVLCRLGTRTGWTGVAEGATGLP